MLGGEAPPAALTRSDRQRVAVMFVVEIAQGRDGEPYSALGALGGLAYVAALVVLGLRR